jgi:hypothetical protein
MVAQSLPAQPDPEIHLAFCFDLQIVIDDDVGVSRNSGRFLCKRCAGGPSTENALAAERRVSILWLPR